MNELPKIDDEFTVTVIETPEGIDSKGRAKLPISKTPNGLVIFLLDSSPKVGDTLKVTIVKVPKTGSFAFGQPLAESPKVG